MRAAPPLRLAALAALACAPHAGAQAAGAARVVEISNRAPYYAPDSVLVRPGQAVEWRNALLSDRHSVHSPGGELASVDLEPGAGWSFRFAREGVYAYRCRFHPWMRGTVVVRAEEPATSAVALPPGFGPVLALARDAAGAVWAVEGEGGASIATGRIARLGDAPRELRLPPGVLLGAGGGIVWLAAADGRAHTAELAGGTVRRFAPVHPPAAADARGVLWSVQDGRLRGTDPSGGVRELALPDSARPLRLAAGSGAVWLLYPPGDRAARIDPATGRFESVALARGSRATEIAAGDGFVWYLDPGAGRLGRAGGDGDALVRIPLPLAAAPGARLQIDDGGAPWILAPRAGRLLRVADGAAAEIPVPTALGQATAFLAGARGVWVAGTARAGVLYAGPSTTLSQAR